MGVCAGVWSEGRQNYHTGHSEEPFSSVKWFNLKQLHCFNPLLAKWQKCWSLNLSQTHKLSMWCDANNSMQSDVGRRCQVNFSPHTDTPGFAERGRLKEAPERWMYLWSIQTKLRAPLYPYYPLCSPSSLRRAYLLQIPLGVTIIMRGRQACLIHVSLKNRTKQQMYTPS